VQGREPRVTAPGVAEARACKQGAWQPVDSDGRKRMLSVRYISKSREQIRPLSCVLGGAMFGGIISRPVDFVGPAARPSIPFQEPPRLGPLTLFF
jgi:hypothetical protein